MGVKSTTVNISASRYTCINSQIKTYRSVLLFGNKVISGLELSTARVNRF